MIKVVYLARLRDCFGVSSEDVANAQTVGELLAHLRARGGVFAAELAEGKAYKIAINKALAKPDAALKAGDEVAFLPPVTGG